MQFGHKPINEDDDKRASSQMMTLLGNGERAQCLIACQYYRILVIERGVVGRLSGLIRSCFVWRWGNLYTS